MLNRSRYIHRGGAGGAAVILALFGLWASVANAGDPLPPNLKALPAYDISLQRNFAGDLEIRFAVQTWNAGTGPLELIAGEVQRNKQNVYQRVYETDGNYVDYLAGAFEWHQAHAHFHFEDYALYTLQKVGSKSKRTSAKTTFCLMDTHLQDGSLPGAPASPVYAGCGNFFQGMSVGWGDEYGQHLPGQEISVERLKDGDYRLIVEADPRNRLIEIDETDNTACTLLRLSISAETLEVLNADNCDEPGPPGGGDVTVAGIDPNFAPRDSSTPVIITGTGFAAGMAVSFENGTGAQPVVVDYTVESDTEITALIDIGKKGKPNADNVWDVRVGPAVLADGFTVIVP